ncbi:response regulator [Virgibacillus dakarensis]|uniref:response regulator n=1 Tax=Virgibacillus dakarensis TaxID=1917889 RepID=UPI000B43FD80|nr:response regulator transcription factor [Virgibacillus dakarensis]
MIKVLFVDDQRLFREGVGALIAKTDDICVIGTADNGEAAIQQIAEKPPNVVLMDIHMPNLDGIKTTVYIKEHYPDIKVIMLTSDVEEDLVIRAISVGADGFLLKSLYADDLIRSIHDAFRGQIVLSGEVARILANKIRELTLDKKQIFAKRLENRGLHFSNRELDIAYLLMGGHTNKHIAQKLFLAEGTVKNYISEIYNKLNIRNRAEIIAFLRKIMR